MLTDRKDIISVVKESLNPLYKHHGLSHDDFKLIAKEATNAVLPRGGTAVEIRTATLRTALRMAPSTGISHDGIMYIREQVGGAVDGAASGGAAAGGAQKTAAAEEDPEYGSGGHNSALPQVVLRPSDQLVTLASFQGFMGGLRARREAEAATESAGRRQRAH